MTDEKPRVSRSTGTPSAVAAIENAGAIEVYGQMSLSRTRQNLITDLERHDYAPGQIVGCFQASIRPVREAEVASGGNQPV